MSKQQLESSVCIVTGSTYLVYAFWTLQPVILSKCTLPQCEDVN